jgi:sulfur-carrier protein
MKIRVALPYHLRNLARIATDEVTVDTDRPTLGAVLDALEAHFPTLRGTIRDHDTLERRPFVRFYAEREDFSFEAPETPLPQSVAAGNEPLRIVGAMAGG